MYRVLLALFIFVAAAYAACSFQQLSNAAPYPGFCSSLWASGLQSPRGIWVVSNGDVIVIESGKGATVMWEVNGVSQRATLVSNTALNQGVTVHGNYLYVSSDTTVWRYSYAVGQRTTLAGQTLVLSGLPGGGHSTRPIAFDAAGLMYITIGSGSNVDNDASRAGVFRWDITTIPRTWADRQPFATGTRNENGIRFDKNGQLWGVENGMDNIARADMGGDIHNENPGEEVNFFQTANKFYGYPYCFSYYNVPGKTYTRGTQFVVPQFNGSIHNDSWCQNPSNVVKPVYLMRAHTAPLDIIFYYGTQWPNMNGDAFVAQHGSWDRTPAVGYRVIHLKMQNGVPVSEEPLLYYNSPTDETGSGWHRPVGLGFAKCQGVDCLLVTSDATGSILAVTATPNCKCPSPSTTTTTGTGGNTGSATTTTTTTTGSIGNTDILQYFIGCLVDNSTNRDFAVKGPISAAGQTNQKCRYYCGLRNYIYSGTQNGTGCWCDNVVGQYGTQQNADCSSLCSGDTNQRCGGIYRNSAYKTGNRTSTGYVGCFIDDSTRDLPNRIYSGPANTIDSCRKQCKTAGYAYAGLQYAAECWCGNSYGNKGGKVADSDCNMACTGDGSLMCGAGWRNSIYNSTLPSGYAYY